MFLEILLEKIEVETTISSLTSDSTGNSESKLKLITQNPY